jgi:serine O-acetyltransferase
MGVLAELREDARAIVDRDPAADSVRTVILAYPGFRALVVHRGTHWLWQRKRVRAARVLSEVGRWLTGADIHPGARLGRRVFLDHAQGVVIGETCVVGDDVTIYQGVTLGGTSLERGVVRHPRVGPHSVIGAGAKVLGPITLGEGCRVGANAVVVADVPPGCVVVGVPGRVVRTAQRREDCELAEDSPDVIGRVLSEVLNRLDRLEADAGLAPDEGAADSTWRDDFSI